MDLIEGLLRKSKHHGSIMVLVNRLSKASHFSSVKSTYSARDISQIFIREIVRLHGVPKKIMSDRDAKFTSNF